jgi:hypothetical protein
METVLWGHPEREVPFCVRQYRILDGDGRVLADVQDNHHARNTVKLSKPVVIKQLKIETPAAGTSVPPAVFAVHCYT